MSDKSDAGFVAAGRAIAPLVNENVRLRSLNAELVEALAGSDPEMAATAGPLSWLREAIKELKARGPADEDSDPPAYWEMVGEIEAMERKCSAVLSRARAKEDT